MAPTICPDKKNPIRSGLNKIRRHSHSSQMMSTSSSSIPSILNYVSSGSRSSLILRSSPDSNQNDILNSPSETGAQANCGNMSFGQFSCHEMVAALSSSTQPPFDSDASLQSTYEYSASSPSSSCMEDDRLSPYSFYHDDENFNSIDSDSVNHQAYISSSSSYKINNSYSYISSDSVASTFPISDYHRHNIYNKNHNNNTVNHNNHSNSHNNSSSISLNSNSYLQNLPFSLSQLSEIKNNTDGLFEIAVKTVKLVKRNQMLQRRLAQLQQETSEFIESVLANPENRAFRENFHRQNNGAEAI